MIYPIIDYVTDNGLSYSLKDLTTVKKLNKPTVLTIIFYTETFMFCKLFFMYASLLIKFTNLFSFSFFLQCYILYFINILYTDMYYKMSLIFKIN